MRRPHIFEKDITRLKVGQNVRLKLSNDLRERRAKVYLIGREIGPDRTVRVHCHLDEGRPHAYSGNVF